MIITHLRAADGACQKALALWQALIQFSKELAVL